MHTEVSGGCDTGGWRTQPMPCVLRAAIGTALRPAKKRRPCLVHNGDDNWDDDEEDLQRSTEEEGRASAMGDKDKQKTRPVHAQDNHSAPDEPTLRARPGSMPVTRAPTMGILFRKLHRQKCGKLHVSQACLLLMAG